MIRDLLGFSDYRYRLADSRNLRRERRHQLGPKKDRQRRRGAHPSVAPLEVPSKTATVR
jgi:hypothetical protein